MQRELIEKIRRDLDKNILLNMFGLVNLARVRAANEVPEGITDEELRHTIRKLFDEEVIGGVQFKKPEK